MNKKVNNFNVTGLILPLIILLAWHLSVQSGMFPPAILPPIGDVAMAFLNMMESGLLVGDILVSLTRVLRGYLLAIFAGVTLGTLMGTSKHINDFFTLTLNSIRQRPILAWIPLIILWLGIGEESKVAVIFLAAFFPILINTISGMLSTPKGLVEVAALYKLSGWMTFRKVYFPSALPQIFVGLKLGLGISWVAVVAAELIAASSGIGFRISDARSMMEPDVMIVGMISIGVLGVSMDKALTLILDRITPWEK
jgi:sulfonate transport system permease protein